MVGACSRVCDTGEDGGEEQKENPDRVARHAVRLVARERIFEGPGYNPPGLGA